MINMNQARARLTELSPALARVDDEHSEEWPEAPLTTVLMGDFAQALVIGWSAIPSDVRQHILDAIEKFMVEGDDTVQTAAATGFVESLLYSTLRGEIDRTMVEAMLGPKSLEYFTEWDKCSDNPHRYHYDKLKENGLLQSEAAEKYAKHLEKWLEDHWHPSAERTEVANVLQELRSAMNGK